MHGRKKNNSEATREKYKIRTQKQMKKRKVIDTVKSRGYKFQSIEQRSYQSHGQ